jgi:hypothetical protein
MGVLVKGLLVKKGSSTFASIPIDIEKDARQYIVYSSRKKEIIEPIKK